MTTRKVYARGILLAVLVLTAGCSGLLGEDQTFEATEISVSDDALEETGYESAEEPEHTFSETVGNDTQVNITSHLSEYETEYDNGSGYFLALASPKADVGGIGIDANPLGEYDKKRLVAEATSRSGEVDINVDEDDLQTVENTTVTVLDTDATVTTYESTVERSGSEVDALIHATRLEHGDDHVIAVGVHPKAAGDGQSDIIRLFEGIEHDVEE